MKLFECKSIEEMRKIASSNKEMNLLVDEIEKLNKEKFFGALYNIEEDQRKRLDSERDEGMLKGARLAKLEDAKNLKENGVDIEIIAKSTGLTQEEIENL